MFEKLIEALEVLVIGMGAIFASLFFFYLLILVLKKIDEKLAKSENKAIAVQNNLSPEAELQNDEITPELIAVLSAAAYSVVRKPIRIKTISFLDDKDDSTWAKMGKMDVIGSHNIQGHQ